MLIKPRVRGFVCTTAHPTGCEANVRRQVEYVRGRGPIADAPVSDKPRRVLVIGASTGYGLASRITAAFGCGAATLGIFFEKPGRPAKTGTAGWYNSAAFHRLAAQEGLYAHSINGDAFSDAIKQQAIEQIRADLGQVDLVVYSLAAPRRTHPATGEVYASILKPVGQSVSFKNLNTDTGEVGELTVPAASQEEIDGTVAVMGGEDWQLWMEALDGAGVLADGAKTTAYTYIGERITRAIYWDGTIGAAKKDLDKRVVSIREGLARRGGDARVSVLQAVVTQASSAIPAMPLYLSILLRLMREEKVSHGCIEQIDSLFRDSLCAEQPALDSEGRLRADAWEMQTAVQKKTETLWNAATTDNLEEVCDFAAYRRSFLQLFGFEVEGVDYGAEADPEAAIEGL